MPRVPSLCRAWVLLAAGLLASPAPARGPEAAAPKKGAPPPSVVLIILDTARADHLHCYGYPLPTSPAIDRRRLSIVWYKTSTSPFHSVSSG